MARYSRLTALLAAAAILAAAVPAAASAADPTTQRVYSAFDRGEYIRSVYKDAHVTYSHEPEVTYFTTGREDPPGDTDPVVIDLRSFFAFDVEATDLSISSAVLRINVPNASFVSDDPSETFALVDVTSNLDALLAGGDEGTPGLDGIWDDLGSGHLYASRTFTADDDGTAVEILSMAPPRRCSRPVGASPSVDTSRHRATPLPRSSRSSNSQARTLFTSS